MTVLKVASTPQEQRLQKKTSDEAAHEDVPIQDEFWPFWPLKSTPSKIFHHPRPWWPLPWLSDFVCFTFVDIWSQSASNNEIGNCRWNSATFLELICLLHLFFIFRCDSNSQHLPSPVCEWVSEWVSHFYFQISGDSYRIHRGCELVLHLTGKERYQLDGPCAQ